jgi:hypothetical protein
MKIDTTTARSWVGFTRELQTLKQRAGSLGFWMVQSYIDMAERQIEYEISNHLKMMAKEKKVRRPQ